MSDRLSRAKRKPLLLAALACYGAAACAATTDIANAPMASSSTAVVKPNVMFIFDDSGSMDSDYLPDEAAYFYGKYGFKSNHCNGVYYNPAVTYTPPVDSTGASYPNASFTGAWVNGYKTSDGTTDLTGSVYYQYKGKVADHAFSYDASGNLDTNSAFYKECSASIEGSWVWVPKEKKGKGKGKDKDDGTWVWVTDGNSDFTQVTVSATSGPDGTDERTNFANWYSYYRTRLLMMKTEVGKAFKNIGNRYRVGYSTIGYTGVDSSSSDFLKIADFDNTQKASWYSKLYSAKATHWTPLRAALSKAGRIYAGKLLTGSDDPIQYSCQQNFTILSTDGYWNTNEETASYGPLKMDGETAVGDQDGGTTARPMLDSLKQSDTLADVAMYYYKTDLRTSEEGNCTGALSQDVCENNVTGSDSDVNPQQHMTSFTLGLGASGTLSYSPAYKTGGSPDYTAILQGTKSWPAPAANKPTAIDDLWHAAVNGRGTYFNAQDPNSLATGLANALAGVRARNGSSSSAATSNLEPVAGDNYVYIALYTTVRWDGNLQARTIDPEKGTISSTSVWEAQPLLDAKVSANSDTRTIYTFDADANDKLKPFTWAELSSAEKAYFNGMCSPSAKLSQCADLTAEQQAAASGENLVNYLRGRSGYEARSGNADPLYRERLHVLGDIVGSQPVYVKKPPFLYVDSGYATFRDTTQKNRAPMVYVAANDGMLHAFNGENGREEWAYIPPMVMPNLYRLADKAYSANHQYFVDGSPTVGDICPSAPSGTCKGSDWKTILVGGLNAGGRGYYALDITDPARPRALWNFTSANDANLGYTFGNPVITKRKDGTWVVVFASGYNNVGGGDGRGYLFVLNANTGAVLEKIDTGVGDTTTPSGLAKINAWVNSTVDNTAERFYGGDLLGNVWRFDIDDVVLPSGKEATRLAEVGQVDVGTQSITVKPELAEISAGGKNHAVVYVATGRYLGTGDLSDTSQQSIYALKDALGATGLGRVRTAGTLVEQKLSTFTGKDGRTLRTTTTVPVDWATQSGWYVDLNPDGNSPGERVTVDMQQQLGLLTVAANVPNQNACTLGGYSWLYSFDYKTGQFVSTATEKAAGQRLVSNALSAGIKTIQLTTGKTTTIVTNTGGDTDSYHDPSSSSGAPGGGKRVSWRELAD
ncbi:MAG TPA: PilC/PilY family type IV pilus protein [Paucimonas sp.]|nr:PilC/PilY family type IV pilus protein [Paucimonas sp.]